MNNFAGYVFFHFQYVATINKYSACISFVTCIVFPSVAPGAKSQPQTRRQAAPA